VLGYDPGYLYDVSDGLFLSRDYIMLSTEESRV
jgi:hypothetical protein